jgi:hypothetical protein
MFPDVLTYQAHAGVLKAGGWKIPQIPDCLNWSECMLRQTLYPWQSGGLGGLSDAPLM